MRPSTAMRPPLCFYSLHYRISRADFRAPPRSSTRCSALTPRAFASGQARVSILRMLRMSSALSLATLGAARKRVTCRSILHPLRRGIRPASGSLCALRWSPHAAPLRGSMSLAAPSCIPSGVASAPPSENSVFLDVLRPASGKRCLPRCACAPPPEFTSFGHPFAPATGSIRFFRVADCLPHGLRPSARPHLLAHARHAHAHGPPLPLQYQIFFNFLKIFFKNLLAGWPTYDIIRPQG